jgi:hypothetical protein
MSTKSSPSRSRLASSERVRELMLRYYADLSRWQAESQDRGVVFVTER